MAGPRKAIPPSFGFRNLDALLLPARNYRYFQNRERFPVDAAAREHSPVNAWWLADCALLVYEDPENVRSVLGSVKCFTPASFRLFDNSRTGLCGFAVQGTDFAVLSLHGTEFYRPADIVRDLDKLASMGTDIRQDMKLRISPFDGPPKFQVPVVQGFCQPLQSNWTDLENWIGSLPRSSNLWLTGHSLGAAMAEMIAFQFPDHVAGPTPTAVLAREGKNSPMPSGTSGSANEASATCTATTWWPRGWSFRVLHIRVLHTGTSVL